MIDTQFVKFSIYDLFFPIWFIFLLLVIFGYIFINRTSYIWLIVYTKYILSIFLLFIRFGNIFINWNDISRGTHRNRTSCIWFIGKHLWKMIHLPINTKIQPVTYMLRSAVGKTYVLRLRLVMDYTTSHFPLILLGYPLDSEQSYGP